MSTPVTDCEPTAIRPASTVSDDVLDLEDLKARCLGNLDLVERVLDKFTGQLGRDLDDLEGGTGR